MSTTPPTTPVPADPSRQTRRLAVFASALFALVIGQLQQLANLGQTPAEFAADSDATLKVVGWAFAIWGPIYLGLIVYAVRQLLPKTHESEMLRTFGWPSVLALLGIGWWILAAAWDLEVATVVLIFGSLIVLLIPLLRKAEAIRALPKGDRDRWMTLSKLAVSVFAAQLLTNDPMALTLFFNDSESPAEAGEEPLPWRPSAVLAQPNPPLMHKEAWV